MENPAAKWYVSILEKVRDIVDRYGLPEDIAADMRAMSFEIAKEQYKAGNRSGIAWLKKKQSEEGIRSAVPVAG